jgi:hypothetical protein
VSWLKEEIKSEWNKVGGLKGRSKLHYIWDYYHLLIIVVVCLVALGSYLYVHIRNTLSDHWFYITFVNTRQDVGTGSQLWDGYMERTNYDLSEKLVEFNDESYFDYTNNYAKGNDYYEVFVAYVDSGTLDAVTMQTDALVLLGESGRLLDLNAEECASIREKYGQRFLYCQPYDTEYSEDLVPVAIDISDSILETEYHLYGEDCALAIGAYSQNVEAVEAFLDYIFEGVEPDA